MLDRFKIEVDFIIDKCVVPILNKVGTCGDTGTGDIKGWDRARGPIVIFYNARVDVSSFDVRKKTVK